MELSNLPWDSSFLGMPVASLKLSSGERDQMEAFLDRINSFKLIYIFSSEELEAFQLSSDFVSVGGKLIYQSLVQEPLKKIPENIHSYRKTDVSPQLLNLALQSGIYSRFKLDKRFPSGTFERLYELWIKGSVDRNIADEVLCYSIDGVIAGMVTLGIRSGVGNIGLIAVDKKFRGNNIGTHLINAAHRFFAEQSVEKLTVATQLDNTNANNFYLKNRFQVVHKEYIYHYWTSNTI